MRFLHRLTLGLFAALTAAQAGTDAADPPASEVVERVRLANGSALLLVPVRLGGKVYPFAIDTGASTGVYDASLAPLLGEPLSAGDVRTADGVTRAPLYRSPDARLGG